MRTTWLIAGLVVAGCVTTTPSQPTGPQPPGPGGDDTTTALPDPNQPMPEGSVGTNGQLSLEQAATVVIDARADIYSAGLGAADKDRGGVMPSALAVAPGGITITFANVHGKTGCNNDTPAADPDGGGCAGGDTAIDAAGSISGIVNHKHTQFLVGVFLGAAPPAGPPASLDFTDNESFADLAPALNQVFFIGDGLTGTGSGDTQRFAIPAGATHLWLGIADAYSFHGAPSYYADNTGGLSVTVAEHR
jgi:hypothetical protein